MRRSYAHLLTLFLVHIVASYCAYIPPLVFMYQHPQIHMYGEWFFVSLAPIFTPCVLVIGTIFNFPHYYYQLPQVWACYAAAFVLVCWLRRKQSPGMMRWACVPVVMTVIVTAIWLPTAIAESQPWRSPLEGKPAPDFTLPVLDGAPLTLSQERGHVIILDFWSIACPPCRAEFKAFIGQLADDAVLASEGLRVLTIDEDDNPVAVRRFMDENHYHFTVLMDTSVTKLYRKYPSQGIPTLYIITRTGIVEKALLGFDEKSADQLRDEINAALR